MSETQTFRMIPGRSVTTSLLISALNDGNPGDEFTDEALGEICHETVSTTGASKGYSALQSAIRHCKRMGVVWFRVYRAGKIRCASAPEKMDISRSRRKSVLRLSKDAVRVLGSVNRDELPDGDRGTYDALMTQHRTLAMFAKSSTTKQIEQKEVAKPVNLSRLLEQFPKNIP